jgi:hypothetical protein
MSLLSSSPSLRLGWERKKTHVSKPYAHILLLSPSFCELTSQKRREGEDVMGITADIILFSSIFLSFIAALFFAARWKRRKEERRIVKETTIIDAWTFFSFLGIGPGVS